jgi:tRNA(Ile)-lysidine synthase
VHIHHGLQSVADDWVLHCQKICDELNIPLDIIYVDATKQPRQSPEESARIVRYAALQENLKEGDCLLTAQHLNDQAETFLLQLFRTASSAGLAAMPSSKHIGNHFHLRPLLFFSRDDIETYADEHSLNWIEDPSNQDDRFERNFIRRKLLPLLKSRWPESVEQLVTVANLQSSNLQVLEDMAAIDLANVVIFPGANGKQQLNRSWKYDVVSVLSIAKLRHLSSARLLNVLRYWVKQKAVNPVAKISPTRKLLLEINKTIIHSVQDAAPVIVFSDYEYRKYQDNLYLLKAKSHTDKGLLSELEWSPSQALFLPALNRRFRAVKNSGVTSRTVKSSAVMSSDRGLKNELLDEQLKISFRQGGEQFHPAGRDRSQSLKKLLQEANIFPWERDNIPLLYWQDELIAVVGLWVAKSYVAGEGESGWSVVVEDR